MKEESDRFFIYFWIFFGFTLMMVIFCTLINVCREAAKERQQRRVRSYCGGWIAQQPVYPHSERLQRSTALPSSPYYPTVIDVSNHNHIPERIFEVSSAPKIPGSAVIDLPPAYNDVMATQSSDHNCKTSNHGSTDVGGGADTGGCSGATEGSSTND